MSHDGAATRARDRVPHLRLGLTARPEGEHLRLVDTATGEKLLLGDEELEEARQAAELRAAAAEERAAEEAAARRAAEERVRSLAEELSRLRRKSKP